MRHDAQGIALVPEDRSVTGLTQSCGTSHHGIQHRLEVRRRARDDPQDLRSGCLLLQRFAQRWPEAFHLGLQICI